jgi:hypothetical protein
LKLKWLNRRLEHLINLPQKLEKQEIRQETTLAKAMPLTQTMISIMGTMSMDRGLAKVSIYMLMVIVMRAFSKPIKNTGSED